MLKANELRVGNKIMQHWDYDDVGPNSHEVIHTIEPYECMLLFEKDIYSPIPLTPEILEKCGFENRSASTDYLFSLGDIHIGGSQKRFLPSYWGESGLEAYGNELKYLHQLQNIYFALTGEELQVNL